MVGFRGSPLRHVAGSPFPPLTVVTLSSLRLAPSRYPRRPLQAIELNHRNWSLPFSMGLLVFFSLLASPVTFLTTSIDRSGSSRIPFTSYRYGPPEYAAGPRVKRQIYSSSAEDSAGSSGINRQDRTYASLRAVATPDAAPKSQHPAETLSGTSK